MAAKADKNGAQQQQYVGVDLHRRRSVIVRMSGDGDKLAASAAGEPSRALRSSAPLRLLS